MNWETLVDRCELLVNQDRGILLSLLFEAEEEMTRECDILEHFDTYTSGTPSANRIYLPRRDGLENTGSGINLTSAPIYKKMISIHVDGHIIKPIFEEDVHLNSANYEREGTPTGYYIKNNILYFSHLLREGTKVRINYYAYQDLHIDTSPTIPDIYHKDLVYYACYIASMKADMNMASNFLNIWNESIRKIKNQEADREMVNGIREVI